MPTIRRDPLDHEVAFARSNWGDQSLAEWNDAVMSLHIVKLPSGFAFYWCDGPRDDVSDVWIGDQAEDEAMRVFAESILQRLDEREDERNRAASR